MSNATPDRCIPGMDIRQDMELAELYDWSPPETTWTPGDTSIIYRHEGRTIPGTWTVYTEEDGDKVEQASFTMFGFGPAESHRDREDYDVVPVGDGEFTVNPPFGNRFDLEPRRSDAVPEPEWGEHRSRYETTVQDQLSIDESAEYAIDHELNDGIDVIVSSKQDATGHRLNADLMHPSLDEPVVIGNGIHCETDYGHTDGYYRPTESSAPGLVLDIPGLGEQGFEYLPKLTDALMDRTQH